MCISLSIPTTRMPWRTHESCIGTGGNESAVCKGVLLILIHRISSLHDNGNTIEEACFKSGRLPDLDAFIAWTLDWAMSFETGANRRIYKKEIKIS